MTNKMTNTRIPARYIPQLTPFSFVHETCCRPETKNELSIGSSFCKRKNKSFVLEILKIEEEKRNYTMANTRKQITKNIVMNTQNLVPRSFLNSEMHCPIVDHGDKKNDYNLVNHSACS
jgi:hypothetical protein